MRRRWRSVASSASACWALARISPAEASHTAASGTTQGRDQQQAALGDHHRHRSQGQHHGRAAHLQAEVVAPQSLDDGLALLEADHDADQHVVDQHEGARRPPGPAGSRDLVAAAQGVVDGPAGGQGEHVLGGVEQRLDRALAPAQVETTEPRRKISTATPVPARGTSP